MKRFVCFYAVLFLFVACGSDSSTGSTTFVAEELTITGNPSIVGESAGTADTPSGFVLIGGVVDSQLGLELTNLSVQFRVFAVDGSLLGSGSVACIPANIAAGGSCTFQTTISLPEASYTSSSSIEMTPICEQGTGTVRSVSLQWN